MEKAETRTKPKASEEKKKLRILMIHGYRQSEAAFRERSGSLRKALKSSCEFIFCEAPHVVPSSESDQLAQSEDAVEKGWWFSAEDDSYNALDRTCCDKGFQQSLDHINEVFKQNLPVDGVIGFSQGGCLLAMLCSIAENKSKWPQLDSISFNFVVLVSAFVSGQEQHSQFYTEPISIPSLHVIGKTDKVIPCDMSRGLTKHFKDPIVFEHDLGHFIPVNSEAKKAYCAFLEKMR